MFTIQIKPAGQDDLSGKLADAELRFTASPLQGMKLIGFAVWKRRTGTGYNVTMPARTYSVNGERRNFALLRPATFDDGANPQNAIQDAIKAAYEQFLQAQKPMTTSSAPTTSAPQDSNQQDLAL